MLRIVISQLDLDLGVARFTAANSYQYEDEDLI